jgi:hypothetical protein
MTSIEWLYKLSKERELDKFDLEQAKEMHKQEIIDSYNTGYLDSECNHINDADQHYHQLTQKG